LEELLITLIYQLRNLAPDQISRISKYLYPTIVGLLNRSGTVVLLKKDAILSARRFDQGKSVIAQPCHSVFISTFFYFRCHCLNSLSLSCCLDARPTYKVRTKNFRGSKKLSL